MNIEKALSKFREDRRKLMLSNERLSELYEESQGKIEVNPLKICDIEYGKRERGALNGKSLISSSTS